MEKLEKKEITEKVAVKALINSFITYGIIFLFILFMCKAFFSWATQNIEATQTLNFSIASSILTAFIIFFLSLFLCRISTYDVFKKCKIESSKTNNVIEKLAIFFIFCGILSVILCFTLVVAKHNNTANYIDSISYKNYSNYKDTDLSIADALTEETINEMDQEWEKYVASLAITELSIIFSCFYLIIYQKKMILLYNELDKNQKPESK